MPLISSNLRGKIRKLFGIAAPVFLLAASVYAQQSVSARAGLITYGEGLVYVKEKPVPYSPESLYTLEEGMRLRTESGRVEMQIGPGAVLRMGENGILFLRDAHLASVQLAVESGSVLVEIFDNIQSNEINIQIGDSCIELIKNGLCRIDADKSRLRIYGGRAQVRKAGEKMTVQRGEAADFADKLKKSDFDLEQKDALHEWAGRRSLEVLAATPGFRTYYHHWIPLIDGWVRNENYGMNLFSFPVWLELQLERDKEGYTPWYRTVPREYRAPSSQPPPPTLNGGPIDSQPG